MLFVNTCQTNQLNGDIKSWCIMDSETRYVWIFEVYCGVNIRVPGIKGSKRVRLCKVQIWYIDYYVGWKLEVI